MLVRIISNKNKGVRYASTSDNRNMSHGVNLDYLCNNNC